MDRRSRRKCTYKKLLSPLWSYLGHILGILLIPKETVAADRKTRERYLPRIGCVLAASSTVETDIRYQTPYPVYAPEESASCPRNPRRIYMGPTLTKFPSSLAMHSSQMEGLRETRAASAFLSRKPTTRNNERRRVYEAARRNARGPRELTHERVEGTYPTATGIDEAKGKKGLWPLDARRGLHDVADRRYETIWRIHWTA